MNDRVPGLIVLNIYGFLILYYLILPEMFLSHIAISIFLGKLSEEIIGFKNIEVPS